MSQTTTPGTGEVFHEKAHEIDQQSGSATDEGFHRLDVLEDVEHPLVQPFTGQFYDPREGEETSLVEEVTFTMSDDDYGTLLVGETGSGKNTVLMYICYQTNRPTVSVNCGKDLSYERLVGHYAPDGEGGFEFQYGLLSQAVRHGWNFAAHEINMATGDTTSAFHGLLDDEEKRKLVIRQTGEIIRPHPNFTFTATMNPTGYAGTKELNSAFDDRLFEVPVPYLKQGEEIDLLIQKTCLTEDEAETLTTIAGKLRNSYNEGVIMTPVGTRMLDKVGRYREIMPLEEATRKILEASAEEYDEDTFSKVIDSHL